MDVALGGWAMAAGARAMGHGVPPWLRGRGDGRWWMRHALLFATCSWVFFDWFSFLFF